MHFYVGIDARLKACTLNHSHDVGSWVCRQLPMEAENGEGVNEGDQDEQILPDQPDGPEAEENAVVMNAGMGGMDAANIQRRRDVVDYLYMLTMAVFLGSMAFMTGSLGRFLIFAGGILFMLL